MDLYITDSLQDMLDMDIKNEIATDLSSVTDFSNSLGLNFSEMPPLLDMDTDNSVTWLNNTSASFVQNLDLYGSEADAVMVNPNSVMPYVRRNSRKEHCQGGSVEFTINIRCE